MKWFATGTLLLIAIVHNSQDSPRESLIGHKATPWSVDRWINSPPLTLDDLNGEVVLVRWWTGPGCPYCANSSAALAEFHETYGDDGLRVIGFYHHKSREPFDKDDVAALAKQLGFDFPVAVDPGWQTLKTWWLETGDRDFTSVSFLLDREGVIRHIHPGGQYVKGDDDYDRMKSRD